MKITKDSHLDHGLGAQHIALIFEHFGDRTEFFVETLKLPDGVPHLPCQLHGPTTTLVPIHEGSDVYYRRRGDRKGLSRMVEAPAFPTDDMTVVAGVHEGEMIVFTAYGGTPSPREPWDVPEGDEKALKESEAFWSVHALTERPMQSFDDMMATARRVKEEGQS